MNDVSRVVEIGALAASVEVAPEIGGELPLALVEPALQCEVEQFLYLEAELLESRRYDDWLHLLADDLTYRVPLRFNRLQRERRHEISGPDEMSFMDDDKRTMRFRVRRTHDESFNWAEDPPSRVRYLITNVRVRPTELPDEYAVASNFMIYRNRLGVEQHQWVGSRRDVLRQLGPSRWQVRERYVLLDQSVLLGNNLSIFF